MTEKVMKMSNVMMANLSLVTIQAHDIRLDCSSPARMQETRQQATRNPQLPETQRVATEAALTVTKNGEPRLGFWPHAPCLPPVAPYDRQPHQNGAQEQEVEEEQERRRHARDEARRHRHYAPARGR